MQIENDWKIAKLPMEPKCNENFSILLAIEMQVTIIVWFMQ